MRALIEYPTDPLRTRIDDELLAVRVHNRLLSELATEALPIRVTAAGGVISLSGATRRRFVIDRAQSLSESVDGVLRVKNRLTIVPAGAASAPPDAVARDDGRAIADLVLETRIKRKLVGLFGTAAFHVGVVASDGMIVLSGEVPEPAVAARMVRVAHGINGVMEVHDLLRAGSSHARH